MSARVVTPRSRWIEAGLAALAAGGPDAVRVEVLAADLGVTKGGFYGHFADRSEFLGALLDEWERRSIDEVVNQVASEDEDVVARILRHGQLTFAPDLLPVDLAVRAWARTDPDTMARLRKVDQARMAFLRSQFALITSDPSDIEARSTLAFTLAIGQHFGAFTSEGRSRNEATLRAFTLLVTAPEQSVEQALVRRKPRP